MSHSSVVVFAAALSVRSCLAALQPGDGPLVQDLDWLGPVPSEPGCVVRGEVDASAACTLHPWTDDTGAPAFLLEVVRDEQGPTPIQLDAVFVLGQGPRGDVAGNEDLLVYALDVDEESSGRWWANQEDPSIPEYGETERDVVQPFEVTFAPGTTEVRTVHALAREGQDPEGSLVELAARFPAGG